MSIMSLALVQRLVDSSLILSMFFLTGWLKQEKQFFQEIKAPYIQ